MKSTLLHLTTGFLFGAATFLAWLLPESALGAWAFGLFILFASLAHRARREA